ncbi:MAG TPA: GIY-YIG nuclease family protein [Gammaproteobacteria bacterium]|nr:GIY-YIG nuclease family protein [Gammaproteobacteria bacterium]
MSTDNWQVYIILCSDNSLYTGISNDVERRLQQHASQRGARYFRGRQPQQLVYLEGGHDRSSASRREAAIKKLRRPDKECLIQSELNEITAVPGCQARRPA